MAKHRDDLTKIKGLGPGSQKLLNDAGIHTFKDLATAPVRTVRQVIDAGGPRYKAIDTKSWKTDATSLSKKAADATPKRAAKKRESGEANPQRAIPDSDSKTKSIPVVMTALDGGPYQPGAPFKIERVLTSEEADLEYSARQEELDVQFEQARSVIQKLVNQWQKTKQPVVYEVDETFETKICRLLQAQNVTAISARFRSKFGHPVSPLEVAITFNVDQKLDSDDPRLLEKNRIPKSYKGVPIKVIEGRFRFVSDIRGTFLRGSCNPASPLPLEASIVGGIPIAAENNLCDFGTLGFSHYAASKIIGLTCHHVVKDASNTIVQLGTNHSWRRFAAVLKTIPPDKRNEHGEESVDCAVIHMYSFDDQSVVKEPPENRIWARGISHDIDAIPSSTNHTAIFLAADSVTKTKTNAEYYSLWKFGNGTGALLEGRVDILPMGLVAIPHDGSLIGFTRNFSIQRIDAGRPYVSGGDSGSIVAIKARVDGQIAFVAIGVLFASLEDSSTGLCCSMPSVIKALDLQTLLPSDVFVTDWSVP